MEQTKELHLEFLLEQAQIKRRTLLPIWIKIFIWIFMITGAAAALAPLSSLLGSKIQLSLYGLSSNNVLSPIGVIIIVLFLLKGIVSFGLWTERRWAVQLGIVDAIAGMIICVIIMGYDLSNHSYNFRLELILLIPYLLRLQKIKAQWLNNSI